ncbi:mucin-5AC-like [Ptychodera flava]|uniref:mucin-5AC-like n=1 Tax=Ptychodera flava TaxID=63121 RepID=UPI00396A81C5
MSETSAQRRRYLDSTVENPDCAYVCAICDKEFESQGQIRLHVQEHDMQNSAVDGKNLEAVVAAKQRPKIDQNASSQPRSAPSFVSNVVSSPTEVLSLSNKPAQGSAIQSKSASTSVPCVVIISPGTGTSATLPGSVPTATSMPSSVPSTVSEPSISSKEQNLVEATLTGHRILTVPSAVTVPQDSTPVETKPSQTAVNRNSLSIDSTDSPSPTFAKFTPLTSTSVATISQSIPVKHTTEAAVYTQVPLGVLLTSAPQDTSTSAMQNAVSSRPSHDPRAVYSTITNSACASSSVYLPSQPTCTMPVGKALSTQKAVSDSPHQPSRLILGNSAVQEQPQFGVNQATSRMHRAESTVNKNHKPIILKRATVQPKGEAVLWQADTGRGVQNSAEVKAIPDDKVKSRCPSALFESTHDEQFTWVPVTSTCEVPKFGKPRRREILLLYEDLHVESPSSETLDVVDTVRGNTSEEMSHSADMQCASKDYKTSLSENEVVVQQNDRCSDETDKTDEDIEIIPNAATLTKEDALMKESQQHSTQIMTSKSNQQGKVSVEGATATALDVCQTIHIDQTLQRGQPPVTSTDQCAEVQELAVYGRVSPELVANGFSPKKSHKMELFNKMSPAESSIDVSQHQTLTKESVTAQTGLKMSEFSHNVPATSSQIQNVPQQDKADLEQVRQRAEVEEDCIIEVRKSFATQSNDDVIVLHEKIAVKQKSNHVCCATKPAVTAGAVNSVQSGRTDAVCKERKVTDSLNLQRSSTGREIRIGISETDQDEVTQQQRMSQSLPASQAMLGILKKHAEKSSQEVEIIEMKSSLSNMAVVPYVPTSMMPSVSMNVKDVPLAESGSQKMSSAVSAESEDNARSKVPQLQHKTVTVPSLSVSAQTTMPNSTPVRGPENLTVTSPVSPTTVKVTISKTGNDDVQLIGAAKSQGQLDTRATSECLTEDKSSSKMIRKEPTICQVVCSTSKSTGESEVRIVYTDKNLQQPIVLGSTSHNTGIQTNSTASSELTCSEDAKKHAQEASLPGSRMTDHITERNLPSGDVDNECQQPVTSVGTNEILVCDLRNDETGKPGVIFQEAPSMILQGDTSKTQKTHQGRTSKSKCQTFTTRQQIIKSGYRPILPKCTPDESHSSQVIVLAYTDSKMQTGNSETKIPDKADKPPPQQSNIAVYLQSEHKQKASAEGEIVFVGSYKQNDTRNRNTCPDMQQTSQLQAAKRSEPTVGQTRELHKSFDLDVKQTSEPPEIQTSQSPEGKNSQPVTNLMSKQPAGHASKSDIDLLLCSPLKVQTSHPTAGQTSQLLTVQMNQPDADLTHQLPASKTSQPETGQPQEFQKSRPAAIKTSQPTTEKTSQEVQTSQQTIVQTKQHDVDVTNQPEQEHKSRPPEVKTTQQPAVKTIQDTVGKISQQQSTRTSQLSEDGTSQSPAVKTSQPNTDLIQPSEGQKSNPPSNQTGFQLLGQTSQPTAVETSQPSLGQTSQPTASQTNQPTAGQTSQPPLGPTSQPTTGQTSRPPLGQICQLIAFQTSQPSLGQASQPIANQKSQPTAGQTSQLPLGPTSQLTTCQTSQPPLGKTSQPPSAQKSQQGDQTSQPTAGQMNQPLSGKANLLTAGQTRQKPLGQTNQPLSGQTSQPPLGQTSQPPSGQTSNPTACQISQPPSGQTSQLTTGQAIQSPSGQTSQPTAGETIQLPRGQTSQPSIGQPSQPAVGQKSQPPLGQPSQPTAGQTSQPPLGQTSQPTADQAIQSSSGQTNQPTAGETVQLSRGQTSQSAVDQTSQPPIGKPSQPTAGQTSQPAAGQTSQPPLGQQSQPAACQTSQPTPGQTSQPPLGQTQPTAGPTSQSTAVQTSQPQAGQTSQPPVAQTSQPPVGQTSQPLVGQTSQPPVGQPSQPTAGQTIDTSKNANEEDVSVQIYDKIGNAHSNNNLDITMSRSNDHKKSQLSQSPPSIILTGSRTGKESASKPTTSPKSKLPGGTIISMHKILNENCVMVFVKVPIRDGNSPAKRYKEIRLQIPEVALKNLDVISVITPLILPLLKTAEKMVNENIPQKKGENAVFTVSLRDQPTQAALANNDADKKSHTPSEETDSKSSSQTVKPGVIGQVSEGSWSFAEGTMVLPIPNPLHVEKPDQNKDASTPSLNTNKTSEKLSAIRFGEKEGANEAKKISNKKDRKSPEMGIGEKGFPCEFCPKRFRLPRSVQQHMSSVHHKHIKTNANSKREALKSVKPRLFGSPEEKMDYYPFYCNLCDRGFDVIEKYEMHLGKFHRKKFQCNICQYSTCILSSLASHVKSHNLEKMPRTKKMKSHSVTEWTPSVSNVGVDNRRGRSKSQTVQESDPDISNFSFVRDREKCVYTTKMQPLNSSEKSGKSGKVENFKWKTGEGKQLTCEICPYSTSTLFNLAYHNMKSHKGVTSNESQPQTSCENVCNTEGDKLTDGDVEPEVSAEDKGDAGEDNLVIEREGDDAAAGETLNPEAKDDDNVNESLKKIDNNDYLTNAESNICKPESKTSGPEKLICNVCNKEYRYYNAYVHHTSKCDSRRLRYKCPECPKNFAASYLLLEHARKHGLVKCQFCGIFCQESKLESHVEQNHHKESGDLIEGVDNKRNNQDSNNVSDCIERGIFESSEMTLTGVIGQDSLQTEPVSQSVLQHTSGQCHSDGNSVADGKTERSSGSDPDGVLAIQEKGKNDCSPNSVSNGSDSDGMLATEEKLKCDGSSNSMKEKQEVDKNDRKLNDMNLRSNTKKLLKYEERGKDEDKDDAEIAKREDVSRKDDTRRRGRKKNTNVKPGRKGDIQSDVNKQQCSDDVTLDDENGTSTEVNLTSEEKEEVEEMAMNAKESKYNCKFCQFRTDSPKDMKLHRTKTHRQCRICCLDVENEINCKHIYSWSMKGSLINVRCVCWASLPDRLWATIAIHMICLYIYATTVAFAALILKRSSDILRNIMTLMKKSSTAASATCPFKTKRFYEGTSN